MGAVAGRRAVLGLVAWCAALAATTALFHALGRGVLAPPPVHPTGWAGWADGRDPLVASVAVLRLLTLALCWYLVGVTAIGIVARLLRAVRLVHLADAVTLPALRRLLHTALGLSLVAVMATPGIGARPDPDRVVLRADAVVSVAAAHPVEPVPPLGLLDTAPPGPPEAPAPAPPLEVFGAGPVTDTADDASGSAVADPSGVGDHRTHRVVPGDSFWRIAEQRLRAHHGRPPTDAEVAVHTDRMIERNRDRLADPANADLIFPGQRLVLPALEGER